MSAQYPINPQDGEARESEFAASAVATCLPKSIDVSRNWGMPFSIANRLRKVLSGKIDPKMGWEAGFWLAFAWKETVGKPPKFLDLVGPARFVMDEILDGEGRWDAEAIAEAALGLYPSIRGDPLQSAYKAACAEPAAIVQSGPRVRVLVATCRNLARFSSKFLLPQRRLADMFGVSQQIMSAMIRRILVDDYIRVECGSWSYTEHKAKVYKLGNRV